MPRPLKKSADSTASPREHPTRTLLIDTARRLLDGSAAHTITADMVLTESGVSKGSLYHFFEDLEDLLGEAMLREFSIVVTQNTGMARDAIARCDSTASLLAVIDAIARSIRAPAVQRNRLNRINLIAFSRNNARFRALLAAEQNRLTTAMTELFARAQQRGWLRQDIDPHAGAVLFQACQFGQVVDEISESPLEDEVWLDLMRVFVRRMFAPEV